MNATVSVQRSKLALHVGRRRFKVTRSLVIAVILVNWRGDEFLLEDVDFVHEEDNRALGEPSVIREKVSGG